MGSLMGIDLLHACMVVWAVDMASYLAVHKFEINPLESDLQETPLTRLHVLHRKLSSQFWTYMYRKIMMSSVHVGDPK